MNVVKLAKLAKYAQILKNFVAYKETAAETMFLMRTSGGGGGT